MSRPIKLRKVCSLPTNCHFGPLDSKAVLDTTITMTVDEYETIRLIDLEGLTQEECSKQMSVARTTIQSIYSEARRKLAEVLVNGKRLIIEGGEYLLCDGPHPGCKKCHKRDLYNEIKNKEYDTMKIAIPADENNVNSSVCASFGRCPYFAIYNVDTKEYEFIENEAADSQGGAGIKASQSIIDKDVTVLIAPRLGQNAADVLKMAKVVLLQSINDKTIEENISAFNEGKLGELTHIHAGFHGQGDH